MDILVNLFITRLIKKESESRYCAFGRELNAHINKDFTINIPVDEDGEPDFKYMKNYMKSLPYSDKLQDNEAKEDNKLNCCVCWGLTATK